MIKLLAPIGYLLALPHTIVGLLLICFMKPSNWKWSEGCLEVTCNRIIGDPLAQTWGFIICYDTDYTRGLGWIRVHERIHVLQSMIFSVIYPLTYLLWFGASYLWFLLKERETGWHRSYKTIPWERWAYASEPDWEKRWGAGGAG